MIIDSLPFSFSPYLRNTEELVIGRMRAGDGCAARTIMACFQQTKKAKKKFHITFSKTLIDTNNSTQYIHTSDVMHAVHQ